MSLEVDAPDAPPVEGEIVYSRVFGAPREVVFRAFTDPTRLARWWGPKGFTNTFHEFDLRPGGAWRFVMHGPNGADYDTVSEFLEVEIPERIVFQHLEPGHRFRMTMIYADEAGKTRLTWRMLLESKEEAEQLGEFLAEANAQNFDRLDAQLAEMA